MKKLMIVAAVAVGVVGAQVQSARAGDRDWATVGKVLTGVAVVQLLAHATDAHVSINISSGPAYCPPAPVVCEPRPVVCAPQPVVVTAPVCEPRPVVVTAPCAPRPALIVPAPVVCRPVPVVYREPVRIQPRPVVVVKEDHRHGHNDNRHDRDDHRDRDDRGNGNHFGRR